MGLFSGRSRERFIPLLFLAVATCAALLTLSWPRPAQAIEPKPYEELVFPTLGEIQIPEYERYELDNGLVVYLMEDHDLPLVSGSATFRTGAYLESFEQTGLAGITGQAMRLGGTVNHAPDELNQLLEQRAASVETSIGDTSGTAGFSTLTEDLEAVFELYADVIMQPAFDETQIALIEGRTEGSISRRNDDPADIASREFRKLIYGDESPYARTVEYESLENISHEDIVSFYERTITPENTILGIVGDFDPDQMKTLIAQTLGNWQAGDGSVIAPPPEGLQQKTGLFFVNQPQLTQSTIHIGHIGGELRNPYHASMTVLNEVLNGFGGRLFNEIRSRQGLAYSVYAFWSPRFDYNGIFIGGGSTRSEATVPFIQSMYQELEKVQKELISETELAFAKDSVLNSFVFNFQTPNQTLSRLIRYEYYDYPTDFVFQFREGVEQATTASVLEAAQVNLDPQKLITIVVGNTAEIEPDLATLGMDPVAIDVTIPNPTT
ncbi:Peptidase M16 inactive domain family [Synechococcus sp. PCC 7335]|uniref:M16 family metallopeptidase n=1 Tax=Synechococcus sp. (strain ATCC 29403 / PCC 7335) TaxID=91464 RepID=UPI00017EC7E0|nr:pitrilysin family protein [Synechococcus sp. PCC 7335]EDX86575.1 Peptidase M16 inactive domain family [Synechococcus sp. PCC 7335]